MYEIIKMNPIEFNKYHKRCIVIKNLTVNHYKNDKFHLNMDPETLYYEIIINNKTEITILPNNTWKEIKRHIFVKLDTLKNGISEPCIICFEKIKTNITCTKCSNNWCGNCYLDMFKNGKGIISCPHCRNTIGEKLPEFLIKWGIEDIKLRLNLN